MKAKILAFYDYLFNYRKILEGKRLSWIDYAKGIAIFLVVYHHAFLGLQAGGLKVSSLLININMAVYSFRVPLFFMLSGLFIQRGVLKRGVRTYIDYRSRILLYPYFLWAFLQIIIGFFFQSYTNFPWKPRLFLFVFYEPKYMGQLWYLLALFNASVMYVLLYTKLNMKATGQLILGVMLYLLAPAFSFNSMLQQFSIFYIYLVIGTLVSRYILDKKNEDLFGSVKVFLYLLPVFIASQYYFLHHENMDPFFISYDKAGFSLPWLLRNDWIMIRYFFIVIIGCVLTVNICFMLQKWGKISFLRVIGFHSLYIYLLHILMVVFVRTLMVSFLHYDNTSVILLIQVIFAVIGSIMVYNVFRHFNMNFLFEYDSLEFKSFFRRSRFLPKYQGV